MKEIFPILLNFYTTSEERSNPDGQLTVKKRISKIFERVKKKHGKIFDSNDEIKLAPRSLAYIVSLNFKNTACLTPTSILRVKPMKK